VNHNTTDIETVKYKQQTVMICKVGIRTGFTKKFCTAS